VGEEGYKGQVRGKGSGRAMGVRVQGWGVGAMFVLWAYRTKVGAGNAVAWPGSPSHQGNVVRSSAQLN